MNQLVFPSNSVLYTHPIFICCQTEANRAMAAAEARRNWQRVTDHWSIQEDALRASKLSHNPSSSSKLDSDCSPGDAAKGLDHSVPGFMPDEKHSNVEFQTEKKWWLHLQPNCGHLNNYSKDQLNALDAKCRVYSTATVNQVLKLTGETQLNEECDIETYLKTATASFVDSRRKGFLACMENDQDDRMQELKAITRDDFQKSPMKKEMEEFWCADDHLLDLNPCNCLVHEQSEKLYSELDSHWIGIEKSEPWWRTTDKDDLSSLVSSKKIAQFENCDLPRPQSKHCRSGPSECVQCFTQDMVPASLDQKAEKEINLDEHTEGSSTLVSMVETECIMGSVQCLASSSDMPFRNDGFATEMDEAEKQQKLDSDLTKAQLLEALCHSQTRAREAEKAAQQAYDEKEHIIKHFFSQASQLFAYRQWLQILQIETLCLQLKSNKGEPLFAHFPAVLPFPIKGRLPRKGQRKDTKRKVEPPNYNMSIVAFALGLSLAGAGLLLGWTMGWLFPAL